MDKVVTMKVSPMLTTNASKLGLMEGHSSSTNTWSPTTWSWGRMVRDVESQ